MQSSREDVCCEPKISPATLQPQVFLFQEHTLCYTKELHVLCSKKVISIRQCTMLHSAGGAPLERKGTAPAIAQQRPTTSPSRRPHITEMCVQKFLALFNLLVLSGACAFVHADCCGRPGFCGVFSYFPYFFLCIMPPLALCLWAGLPVRSC